MQLLLLFSPPFFLSFILFLLSFSFAGVIFEVIGAQKTYLLAFVRSDESTFRWVRLRKRRAYNLAGSLYVFPLVLDMLTSEFQRKIEPDCVNCTLLNDN